MGVPDDELADIAGRHLWAHWAPVRRDGMGTNRIFTHGHGCELWDTEGRRYLDGLAALFVVQAGYGRSELAAAAAAQADALPYFPLWGHAHRPGIELAARLAELAPGDLNRVFFTSGGSESVESAWKLARQYFKAVGQPARTKVVARTGTYHGTTMGALSITGLPALRTPFEPLVPGVSHVATTNRYRCDLCSHADACTLSCADDIDRAILAAGPETVCAVFLEPLQNAGGSIPPTAGYFDRVREICDRHGVLLVSDEVICAFGRLGSMFGAERYGYEPDMITFAKGVTSGYAPLGGVLVSDRIADGFIEAGSGFSHGLTFGGHPVSCAVALANLDVFEREGLVEHVAANSDAFRSTLSGLLDLPLVGDLRGDGYFWALELVATPDGGRFTAEETRRLIADHVGPKLLDRGVIARAADRGDPCIQLSPPLIAGPDEFDELASVIAEVLTETSREIAAWR